MMRSPMERSPGIDGLVAVVARLERELKDARNWLHRIQAGTGSGVGPEGPPGQDGQDGADGADGEDGRTILNGTTDPTALIGVDGDFYINTATWFIFGPKTGGAWGSGVDIVGEDGADGAPGTPGTPGTNGTDGVDGVDGAWGGAITIPYTFSTTTTDADPGAGTLRLDNATQTNSNVIRADYLDNDGGDWTNALVAMAESGSVPAAHIRLVAADNPTQWLLFNVYTVDDPGGYVNINCTVEAQGSQGASNFLSNGEACYLLYDRAGDAAPNAIPVFNDNTDRNTAFPSPVFGDRCTVLADSTGEPSEQFYDGTGWLAWDIDEVAYTPTLSGIGLGTGGNAFSLWTYRRQGHYSTLEMNVILGSSGMGIASPCTFTVPSGMNYDVPGGATFVVDRSAHGQANYVVNSNGYTGYCRMESATVVRLLAIASSGSYLQNVGITLAIPASWGAGDALHARITYRLDDPYE